MYDLIASMTLLASVYLVMFGIQTFVIKDRRRLPHEAIRATTSLVLGLFIFTLWVVWIGKPVNSTAAVAANVEGAENLDELLKAAAAAAKSN